MVKAIDNEEFIQVEPSHYFNLAYVNTERFISYSHQITEVIKLQPEKILEIGKGNGITSYFLKRSGFKILTMDVDERLNPDIVGNVLNIPFDDESFDLVICYEVLEHLPFNYFPRAISEIYRVTSKYSVISVPDSNWYFSLMVKASRIGDMSIFLNINRLWNRKHSFNGEHYWEIGKKGYSLRKITKKIKASGFIVERTYRVQGNPYHRFFVLRKIAPHKNLWVAEPKQTLQ